MKEKITGSFDDWVGQTQRTKLELNKLSPTMCMAKWLWTSIHLTNGLTNSCFLCPVHKINPEGIIDNPSLLHNTPEKKEQRKMMKAGERPDGCSYCWNIEDMGEDYLSDRHYRSSEPWALEGWDEVVKNSFDYDITPRYVEINFNHACNLACSYCSPHLSSKWAEDIEKHGSYPTLTPHNSIDYFKKIGHYPILNREHNPYVEAFWKWWPELYPKLKEFRMTGGEPLMDKNTIKVLNYVLDHPRPDLQMAVTTNASVPDKNWERFINPVSTIISNNMLKWFRLYVSLDTWGEQAEYIRDGLDFNKAWNNVHDFLNKVPQNGLVCFIVTFNILSLPNLKKLFECILELQKKYNHLCNSNRIFFDTPMLRFPTWQSLQLAPESFWHYADECLEYMKQNKYNKDTFIGFKRHQIDRFQRSVNWMKQDMEELTLLNSKENFYRFFSEYDKRRDINFLETFPEFTDFWEECRTEYIQNGGKLQ